MGARASGSSRGEEGSLRARRLELAAIAVEANSELAPELVLDGITRRARELIGADRAVTSMTAGPGLEQRVVVASPWRADLGSLPTGCALHALVCRTGQALRRTKAEIEAHAGSCPAAGEPHLADGGWLAAPLTRRDGSNMGLIQVFGKHDGELSDEDEALVVQLAQLASVAIVNAQLFDAVQRHARELEERVAERTAELSELNASLEAFACSVSHDLRNPLQLVQSYADVLAADYAPDLPEKGQRCVRGIVAATDRMSAMISDLLELSRLGRDALELEPIALSAVVREAAAQVEGPCRETGAGLTVAEPLLDAVGNGPLLVQAVANLLANAIKYVPAGTVPEIAVSAELRGDDVRLWVHDNGIGIAAADQQRIFDAFQRAAPREDYSGSGVGLAIVRNAVRRMHGRAGVESTPGRGSAFWIELPAADPAGRGQTPGHAAPALAPRGSGETPGHG